MTSRARFSQEMTQMGSHQKFPEEVKEDFISASEKKEATLQEVLLWG